MSRTTKLRFTSEDMRTIEELANLKIEVRINFLTQTMKRKQSTLSGKGEGKVTREGAQEKFERVFTKFVDNCISAVNMVAIDVAAKAYSKFGFPPRTKYTEYVYTNIYGGDLGGMIKTGRFLAGLFYTFKSKEGAQWSTEDWKKVGGKWSVVGRKDGAITRNYHVNDILVVEDNSKYSKSGKGYMRMTGGGEFSVTGYPTENPLFADTVYKYAVMSSNAWIYSAWGSALRGEDINFRKTGDILRAQTVSKRIEKLTTALFNKARRDKYFETKDKRETLKARKEELRKKGLDKLGQVKDVSVLGQDMGPIYSRGRKKKYEDEDVYGVSYESDVLHEREYDYMFKVESITPTQERLDMEKMKLEKERKRKRRKGKKETAAQRTARLVREEEQRKQDKKNQEIIDLRYLHHHPKAKLVRAIDVINKRNKELDKEAAKRRGITLTQYRKSAQEVADIFEEYRKSQEGDRNKNEFNLSEALKEHTQKWEDVAEERKRNKNLKSKKKKR